MLKTIMSVLMLLAVPVGVALCGTLLLHGGSDIGKVVLTLLACGVMLWSTWSAFGKKPGNKQWFFVATVVVVLVILALMAKVIL